jgi:hypothetical protein
VMPQCLENKIWGEPDMQAQSLACSSEGPIKDFRRSPTESITGLSMGGFGTWELAVSNPRTLRRLVPICSGYAVKKRLAAVTRDSCGRSQNQPTPIPKWPPNRQYPGLDVPR